MRNAKTYCTPGASGWDKGSLVSEFGRRFVEVRLDRNGAEIRCGFDDMSWDSFRNAVFWLNVIFTAGEAERALGIQRAFFTVNCDGTILNFLSILEQTSRCQCSDERDRLYANLNLVRPSYRSGLEPDYFKSTSEVYNDIFKHNLKPKQGLAMLAHAIVQDWEHPKSDGLWRRINLHCEAIRFENHVGNQC